MPYFFNHKSRKLVLKDKGDKNDLPLARESPSRMLRRCHAAKQKPGYGDIRFSPKTGEVFVHTEQMDPPNSAGKTYPITGNLDEIKNFIKSLPKAVSNNNESESSPRPMK